MINIEGKREEMKVTIEQFKKQEREVLSLKQEKVEL